VLCGASWAILAVNARATKARIAAFATSGALAFGLAGAPAAMAQPQQGHVNVNIEDVAVVVPINAAANISGVSVGVLVEQLENGPVQCDSRSGQDVVVSTP
jgi:L-aminopeptidase/D-esterase-like protein